MKKTLWHLTGLCFGMCVCVYVVISDFHLVSGLVDVTSSGSIGMMVHKAKMNGWTYFM